MDWWNEITRSLLSAVTGFFAALGVVKVKAKYMDRDINELKNFKEDHINYHSEFITKCSAQMSASEKCMVEKIEELREDLGGRMDDLIFAILKGEVPKKTNAPKEV